MTDCFCFTESDLIMKKIVEVVVGFGSSHIALSFKNLTINLSLLLFVNENYISKHDVILLHSKSFICEGATS